MSTLKIKEIVNNHESAYPNGLGSMFRCIKQDSYQSLENQIKEVITTNIINDLYPDIKEIHSKKEIKEWISQM